MAIKCPKCGADNMYNAIFCRQCGDKLDLGALKIEDQLGLDESGKGGKASRIANQVVGSILALVLIVVLVALFLPQFGAPSFEEPSEELNQRLKQVTKPAKEDTLSFDNQELTNLLQKRMKLPKEGEATILPDSISAVCREDGTVKLVLKSTVFGFLPLTACAVVTPSVPDGKRGGLVLSTEETPVSYSLGWLPPFLPEAATEPFVEEFRTQAQSTIDGLKKSIKGVTVSEGSISFTVAPGKKKAAKKAQP